jgi:hypothetical protein
LARRFGGVDRKTQTIKLEPTPLPAADEMLPATTMHYDTLVLAIGSQVNDFGTPGVLEHCHFIDDIGEATAFNEAARSERAWCGRLPIVLLRNGVKNVYHPAKRCDERCRTPLRNLCTKSTPLRSA